MRNLLYALLFVSITGSAQDIPPQSASTDAIINLPVADAWQLFTTEQGLSDIGYRNVSVKLLIGEHIHAERKTGDNTEIINATLSSFDPQHMMSWQWTDKHCWSVLYFNQMGAEMTQIRWLDFCPETTSIDLNIQSRFHRGLFDQLIHRYAPECHVCKEEREAAEKEKMN